MRSLLKSAFVAALLATVAGSVQAAPVLITTDAGYTGPGLDLSAYANGNYNFTFGPIIIDGYTFTANPGGGGNSGGGSVVGQGSYGLGANGSFGGDAVYIGVDSATGSDKLIINGGPVSQLGFFMNYAPGVGNDATISALDVNGNAFATFDIATLAPISTPNGFNEFMFRGIADDTASIYGLEFGGNYLLLTGTANGVPPTATPEPASAAMVIIGGLAAAGGSLYRRIRRRRDASNA